VPGTSRTGNVFVNTTQRQSIEMTGVKPGVGPGNHALEVRLKQMAGVAGMTLNTYHGGNGYLMLLPQ
jgi:hypothetical protein